MTDTDKNMELWNSVCTTDPANTKQVNQRGGFTAICAQSQRKRATEVWGPYGKAWGLKEMSWSIVGDPPVELVLEAAFYYPGGAFPLAGDIKWKAGDDCRKKLLTDVTTKALSMLGYNSDVFEGKYDDNKYVADLKREKQQAKAPPQPSMREKVKAKCESMIKACSEFDGEGGITDINNRIIENPHLTDHDRTTLLEKLGAQEDAMREVEPKQPA